MSNPLIDKHGWVTQVVIGDTTLAEWGTKVQCSTSTADIELTLAYTRDTTPTTVTPITQTAGSTLIMKMDSNPLFHININGFSGDNGTNTINGSTTPVVLKNQGDWVLITNHNVIDTNIIGYGLGTASTGILPILHGGTGQTTANAALNALLPLQLTNNGKFLMTNGSTTSWNAVPSNYDGFVGIGGNYATVSAALADNKKSIVVISNTTETTNVLLTESTNLFINNGVNWTLGDHNIQFTVDNITFHFESSGIVTWSPTTAKSLVDGTTHSNGAIFFRDTLQIDGSASTADNCSLYSNMTSAISQGITQIIIPNQNNWGIDLDGAAIIFEEATVVFLNISGTGNAYRLYKQTTGFEKTVGPIILVGTFDTINPIIDTVGVNHDSITFLAIAGPQTLKLSIGMSLLGVELPAGGAFDITINANNAQIRNCNIDTGNIDIASKTGVKLINVSCDTILNSASDTILEDTKRTADAIAVIRNLSIVDAPTANDIVITNATGIPQDSGKQFSIDGTFTANSDALIPTQKAIKAYVDASVTGLWDFRGSYDASSGLYPSSGGSGTSGAILKADAWVISVAGTIGSLSLIIGDVLLALVDTPAQIAGNWDGLQVSLYNNSITNSLLAQAPANTWKGNNTGTTANEADNSTSSLTESTSSVLTISGAANALLNAATIQVKQATTSQSGYLNFTDWNTFNNKQTSTLASSQILVGNASNIATPVAMSADATISNTGVVTVANSTNLKNGVAGAISYQSGVGATGFSAAGTAGQLLVSGGASAPTWTNATATPTASTISKWDANLNFNANNYIESITSTATSAGTSTLTASSTGIQVFTGTTTHTVVLPNATTLLNGISYKIENESTDILTINKNGGTLLTTINGGVDIILTLVSNASAAGTWHVSSNSSVNLNYLSTHDSTTSATSGSLQSITTTASSNWLSTVGTTLLTINNNQSIGGSFTVTTNEITLVNQGIYQVNASFTVSGGASFTVFIQMVLNSGFVLGAAAFTIPSNNYTGTINIPISRSFANGDIISFKIQGDAGGNSIFIRSYYINILQINSNVPILSFDATTASVLTTSLAAFNAASAGTAISISATEYIALQSISGAIIVGRPNVQMTTVSSYSAFNGTNAWADTATLIPTSTTLYAFTFWAAAGTTQCQMKAGVVKTSLTNAHSNVVTVTTTAAQSYYVIKTPLYVAPAASNVALYADAGTGFNSALTDATNYGFSPGNVLSLINVVPPPPDSNYLIQGISR